MKLGAASFALAFAVIVPAALEATPMTITFTGTPTLKKGVFGPETAEIAFGSFTYDSDAVDSRKGPKRDKFVSNLFGNDANVAWGFEVTLGRTTRSLPARAGSSSGTETEMPSRICRGSPHPLSRISASSTVSRRSSTSLALTGSSSTC